MRIIALGFISLCLAACQQPPSACGETTHSIAQVQGTAEISPLLGQRVTLQGVVLAPVYLDGPMPGLMLQSVEPDNDPQTAEGILLSLEDAANYQVGQILTVQGTVAEIEQQTSLVDATVLNTCGQSSTQPIALSLPLAAEQSWEAYEGMWVAFSQPLLVADTYPLGRYGEILLANERLMVPTQVVSPGEAAAKLAEQQNRQEIWLDDGHWQQNPDPLPYPNNGLSASSTLRIGDQVLDVAGIVHQDERGYRILPTSPAKFVSANPRPAVPTPVQQNELRIASYNVLNFFTGNGQDKPFPTRRGARSPAELARQQAKLVEALVALDADIIGLLELENNGYDEGSAIATLLAAVNERSASPYSMITTAVAPGSDAIKVGMFYRSERIEAIGQTAVNTAAPFTRLHRPPLAQSFRHLASNQQLTLALGHLKSKGSCPRANASDYALQKDQADGQACWNAARVEAVTALQQWLTTTPTGIATSYQVVLGDLNAYRFEDPITYLEQQGWQYLDENKHASYSFVFRGRAGSLDHMLASPALAQQLSHFQHWPINADEPVLLDYSLRFKSAVQQQQLYAPTPYRSSDHDPIIATFRF
ncbi:ExeM/NucH family extracellular endonuclease [Alishewanella sp. SMS8]|uniref:ExeM/NucH family extracellular endonuclease n=1 Tax=Alishewanella sp. SMS8 TaxID=2994676 RepID=UPI002741AB30|nr:ExeM/NucH family extracellular endonuclease [Alishewanella sp. SMS8]MDP5459498.1 ExeM/NucH family extracellular endonuclease [Alishewanella sp. SMS8]